MVNLKKKIPLSVLEMLEPFLAKGLKNVRLIEPDKFLLKFIDTDAKSDFYFNIETYKIEQGTITLLIDRKPQSKDNVANSRNWIDGNKLEQFFSTWVSFLNAYENIKTIYDDPIEKKYEEEFYSEFEIVDDDATVVSFNLSQQIWLDKYLEKVISILEEYPKDEKTPEIDEISNEVNDLKSKLTTLTKKQVVEKLSKIWAKVRKQGLILLKTIYLEARKELIKQLIESQIGKLN